MNIWTWIIIAAFVLMIVGYVLFLTQRKKEGKSKFGLKLLLLGAIIMCVALWINYFLK